MLQHGNVADDPSYLSDIAAAIADCDTHEYQEILEETDVCIIVLSLWRGMFNLIKC